MRSWIKVSGAPVSARPLLDEPWAMIVRGGEDGFPLALRLRRLDYGGDSTTCGTDEGSGHRPWEESAIGSGVDERGSGEQESCERDRLRRRASRPGVPPRAASARLGSIASGSGERGQASNRQGLRCDPDQGPTAAGRHRRNDQSQAGWLWDRAHRNAALPSDSTWAIFDYKQQRRRCRQVQGQELRLLRVPARWRRLGLPLHVVLWQRRPVHRLRSGTPLLGCQLDQ